jgi:hypothetical protein
MPRTPGGIRQDPKQITFSLFVFPGCLFFLAVYFLLYVLGGWALTEEPEEPEFRYVPHFGAGAQSKRIWLECRYPPPVVGGRGPVKEDMV